MEKNIEVVNKAVKNSSDKLDCFARISSAKCNALKQKQCPDCSFYKNKSKVPHYQDLFKME